MKYKLRLRGADTHFDCAWFLMPFPPGRGEVFKFKGKMWEVKGIIHNPSEDNPHDGKILVDHDDFLSELTVESFPII